mmetsp:Transcript_56571/g.106586  ORF Transcript_56571/g.106586 Transcript_56571/m.106586 type:complete len:469 (-) Transcript_56571:88-1494(-)
MGSSTSLHGLSTEQVISSLAEYFHSRGIPLDKAFAFLDGDRTNFIHWDEFQRGIDVCLTNAGYSRKLSRDELYPIFKQFDVNNDGKISLEEFAAKFAPSTSVVAREWYAEARRGPGVGMYHATRGIGGASLPLHAGIASREVMDSSRVDWVIGRIASSIHRAGYQPSELFNKVDLDRSGRLSYDELERVITSFQPDLSTTEKHMVFRRFDRDGTMDIDVHEFCTTLAGAHGESISTVADKLRSLGEKFKLQSLTFGDAFRAFDIDGDGLLTKAEWQRAINLMAPDISLIDQENIYNMFDINKDGFMNTLEFERFFQDCIDRSPTVSHGLGTASFGTRSLGTASYGTGSIGTSRGLGARMDDFGTGLRSTGFDSVYTGAMYPAEEPWEREVLDTIRNCLSAGRSGLTIGEVFRRLDISRTNYMSLGEFTRMVSSYRRDLNTYQMERLFRIVNYSGSGQISLGEFTRRFG